MTDLNNCFKSSDIRTTVAEAIEHFSLSLQCVSRIEKVPLCDALGRILATDLKAHHNIPPHDNSAVDGYAVYYSDLKKGSETLLPITGRVAAGHPLGRPSKRGEAVEIFTGAQIPSGISNNGPDTIFMIEDIIIDGHNVILPDGINQYANYRKMGEDVKSGDVILRPGHKIRPQDVSMAASLGYSQLEVYCRIKVGVFSTGDEIQDVGEPLKSGCIYDANRYSLLSMLESAGCAVTDMGIFPDIQIDIQAGIWQAAADHDLLITSGGVSKGKEDHIRSVVDNLGALHFWNLAIKPGRPIALGHIRRKGIQVPFIGLPGNPVAVMVTFLCIARPLILLLSGARDYQPQLFQVVSGFNFIKKIGRREWLRASLKQHDSGGVIAIKYESDGSGIISSMVNSDGLIELPEECEVIKKGDLINFLPYKGVM
jgi:molybdopterin molybdotransferase